MADKQALIPAERIERSILFIRGQKIMLDKDLAELYGVQTKAFNRAVKRNQARFPPDFMFQLTAKEFANLRLQNWHLKLGRSSVSPVRLHGARRGHAIQRAKQ